MQSPAAIVWWAWPAYQKGTLGQNALLTRNRCRILAVATPT